MAIMDALTAKLRTIKATNIAMSRVAPAANSMKEWTPEVITNDG
jgi:hypothetical protein